jgi:protein-S-isoprenylcysteine O-methyltransferase Ste14
MATLSESPQTRFQRILGSSPLSGALGDILPAAVFLYFAAQTAIFPMGLWLYAARYGCNWLIFVRFLATSAALVFYLTQFVLFIGRKPVRSHRSKLFDVVIALAGAYLLALPIWSRPLSAGPTLYLGFTMSTIGSLLSTLALRSLSACWGLLPEARGLVTGGMYRIVRNPIYVAEEIAILGGLLIAPSWIYASAVLVQAILQVLRARREERVLSATFPDEYERFKQRTRWRFIPGLYCYF